MSEDDKPFTVSDRRHFTPEGSLREEAPEPERTSVPAPTAEADHGAVPQGAERKSTAGPPPEVDFAGFLLSLGAQAGAMIEAVHEKEGEPAQALDGARSIIAILEMLKGKTEGRRTDEEERILDTLLYELRLGYVGAAEVAGL